MPSRRLQARPQAPSIFGMPDPSRPARGPWGAGCAIAVAIGLGIVAADVAAFSLLGGRRLDLASEAGPLLLDALCAGAPFGALALAGARRPLPWLVALFPTLALWIWATAEGVAYQRHPDGSGANIGLGLILLVAPLPIAAAALAVHALQQRRRRALTPPG